MWLWNRGSEFTKWQHRAMWYVTLGWHAIEFAQTAAYWNPTSGIDFDYITAVDMSFCTSLRNFIQIGPPSAEKMTSCRFSRWRISLILDFRDPIMGSLKSLCAYSYRSSIENIALNCLVFWENRVFCILVTDRLTDEQMDSTDALSRSSCREWRLTKLETAVLVHRTSSIVTDKICWGYYPIHTLLVTLMMSFSVPEVKISGHPKAYSKLLNDDHEVFKLAGR